MRIISTPLFLVVWLGLAGCEVIVANGQSANHGDVSVPTAPVVKRAGGVSFIAFGDAGFIGHDSSQTNVAAAMQHYCQQQSCDFGLVAGDNIYPSGADGADDRSADLARFDTMFISPFGGFSQQASANFRFYMALGNHDWYTSREGAFAQIAFHEQTRPFHMNGPFYSVVPPSGNGKVEVFVLDTEMLLSAVMVDNVKVTNDGVVRRLGGKKPGGWKDALPKTLAEKNQLAWFKAAIAQSTAQWKIVLAHHPLWESKGSKFAQAEALRGLLLPTLCAYADAWFAGHQHTLEVHEVSCPAPREGFLQSDALASGPEPTASPRPLLHVVSGAAAKARPVSAAFSRWQSKTYPELNPLFVAGDTQGFVHARIDNDDLQLRVLGAPAAAQSPDDLTELFMHGFKNRSVAR